VVGIVCALDAEARHLRARAEGVRARARLADGSLLAVSGMGAAAAAAAARTLIGAGARALVSFGLAGGLDPALAPGDLCLPRTVIGLAADGLAGTELATSESWRERLARALAAQGAIAEGALVSAPRVIASVADKAALRAASGAVAVDMESLAVALVAAEHHLPFIAARVIVDGAADALPRAVAAAGDASGQISPWRLLAGLARSPQEIAPLIRLGARYRAASRSLARVARAGAWPQRAFS
jgi:adenosylhomocysteine nucleosidase